MRLPPPQAPYHDEDPRENRRRSPVSVMQEPTPPAGYHQYSREHEYDHGAAHQRHSPGSQRAPGTSDVMRMSNLMESGGLPPPRQDASREIDRGMLGRLNNSGSNSSRRS
jgi:hypothetical protein